MWLATWMLGCSGDDETTTPPTDEADADTDTDSDTDTDTDTDSDTDTDTDTDTNTKPTKSTGDTGPAPVFTISSPDMMVHTAKPCLQQLPTQFWCTFFGGNNRNPQIDWSGVPAGTVSLALVLEDASINFLDHWGVYNLDPAAGSLPQGATGQDLKGAGQTNPYSGPCSDGENTYRWRLLAFDAEIKTPVNDIADIEQFAADGHQLGSVDMCHCPANDCLAY